MDVNGVVVVDVVRVDKERPYVCDLIPFADGEQVFVQNANMHKSNWFMATDQALNLIDFFSNVLVEKHGDRAFAAVR